jgi:hypothetical protein
MKEVMIYGSEGGEGNKKKGPAGDSKSLQEHRFINEVLVTTQAKGTKSRILGVFGCHDTYKHLKFGNFSLLQ